MRDVDMHGWSGNPHESHIRQHVGATLDALHVLQDVEDRFARPDGGGVDGAVVAARQFCLICLIIQLY